jgi:hypothetical protein
MRPWIEPTQSFEKYELGLGAMFLNSLRLTWQMRLLADRAVLLRTKAWLAAPQTDGLLSGLQPEQMEFGWFAAGKTRRAGKIANHPQIRVSPKPLSEHPPDRPLSKFSACADVL